MPLQVPDTEDAKTFHAFFSLTPGIVQLQPVVFLTEHSELFIFLFEG